MLTPVRGQKGEEPRHSQTTRAGFKKKWAGVGAPQDRRQKVNDAVRLTRERVRQSLAQKVIKPNAPIGRGRAAKAKARVREEGRG